MAGVLVYEILKQLDSLIVNERTVGGVRLIFGVSQGVLMTLTSKFQAIQAVIDDAEKKQAKDNAVRDWLYELQDTAYDIDDVLDEWNTIIVLKKKEAENASKSLKVCSLIPYYLCCCAQFAIIPYYLCFCSELVVLRCDIARKINNLNRKLDTIAREKNWFRFSLTIGDENEESEMNTSFVDLSEIYGRDHDKNRLVSMLSSESSQGPALPIISIVGVGGIGKTTLAQLVYRDDKVNIYFDKKIWVHVSDPFDQIRIAKAILKSLNGTRQSLGELEPLLEQICQSLKGKKFLLILDDVWIEESKDWESLRDSLMSLMHDSQGSRILVTTRKEHTARVMGTSNIIAIGALSDQESWSLFSQIALSQRTTLEFRNLEHIGRKIVEKCKGLPLAIKTLGSLLRFKRKTKEWERVLSSELWELEEIEKGLFPPLLLSYCDLPFRLRKCFSYCAIFPKYHDLEKDELIKLWEAQGYLKVERDNELVGKRYFEELAMRSFFQDFERSESENSIEKCKMHDIVHDFAQFLSKNECFMIEAHGTTKLELESSYKKARECFMIEAHGTTKLELESSYKKARHLLIIGGSIGSSTFEKNKLRSLIVKDSSLENGVLIHLFRQLTCLRSLNLSGLSIKEIPSNIKKLIHLRYLNLSQNRELKKLPETLCNLYNLQTLDLSYCESLKRLPGGIHKLSNLRIIGI